MRDAVTAAALLVLLGGAVEGRAAVHETREKALSRVFPPPAKVARSTSFLTTEQRARAGKAAEAPIESVVITRYAGTGSTGESLGVAYFDQHVVRTQPEVLMIVIAPDRSVRSVDILAFAEPEDYLPRPGWLKRIQGKKEEDGLFVGRALSHVTGATLTTRAIATAVRRVLAVDSVLAPPIPTRSPPERER